MDKREEISKQCGEIENSFYEKFEVHVVIASRKLGMDRTFCLEKFPSYTKQIPYYTISTTVEGAKRYIDRIKQIPSSAAVFDSVEEKNEFIRERMSERKDGEENELPV